MSEMMQVRHNDIRKRLLATASAFALFAVGGGQSAQAEDGAGTPLVWIELGGQLDAINDGHALFTPSDLLETPRPAFETVSPYDLQRGPRLGWDSDASITFLPSGTEWVLSASVRYGRALRTKLAHEQPPPISITPTSGYAHGPFAFYQASARTLSTHLITDFKVGRDVGLGMLGLDGHSVISLGVRYANFDSTTDTQISSQPTNAANPGNLFHATAHIRHSFNGAGPSISWDASAPVLGNPQDGSLWLDWGANAALLFGKQNVSGSHQTRAPHRISYANFGSLYSNHLTVARGHERSVPNLGGYASISYRLQDVKISFGYRADLFFGAVDGGIDAAKSYDRGFYGPFAKISVGIGG